MAYLGLSQDYPSGLVPESKIGLMVITEYINPLTGERIFTGSTAEEPPPGFIRADLVDPAKPNLINYDIPQTQRVIVQGTRERLTAQQIEAYVKPAPADNTGLLYLLALVALAFYA